MHLRLPSIAAGNDRVLTYAIGASIILHGIVLAIHFQVPEALRNQFADQRLEVVLVNTKTRERPAKAEVLAQANLDRGGNVDENRRAKTPLPVIEPLRSGK